MRQITRDLGQNIHPMWSPNGSRILFNTTHFAGLTRNDEKAIAQKRVIGEARDDSIDLATIVQMEATCDASPMAADNLRIIFARRTFDSAQAATWTRFAGLSHECRRHRRQQHFNTSSDRRLACMVS